MFAIERLSKKASDYQSLIQIVANIEALVQPYDAWTYQTLLTLLEQDSVNVLIVYDNSNQAIAYCLYQVIFEQAEILRIGTHPSYQRQGVASKLFAELNRELIQSQVESLLLEVRADNLPAIALYEQQTFCVIHKRKGYYQMQDQPATDALIMQRVYT